MNANEWNEKHPIGTHVRYWPILPAVKSAPPVDTQTRSDAWELGDGTPVVLVKGRTGGVHLGHLEVIAREVDAEPKR